MRNPSDTIESLSVTVDLTDYAYYLATISLHVPELHLPYRVMHTAVYLTQLTMTGEEVLEHFKHYNQSLTQKGDTPEFSRLFSVPKEQEAIEQFINTHKHRMDEYLPPLLRAHGCNFN